jgi:hypothetical protein
MYHLQIADCWEMRKTEDNTPENILSFSLQGRRLRSAFKMHCHLYS